MNFTEAGYKIISWVAWLRSADGFHPDDETERVRTGFELVENQFKGAINKSLKALEDKEFQ